MKKIIFFWVLAAMQVLYTQTTNMNALGHLNRPEFKQRGMHAQHQLRPTQVNTIYFSENFNNGIPSTWTVTDNAGTGAVWEGVTDRYGNTLDGSPFVIADSDMAGSVNMDTSLESPEIDLSSASGSIFLYFEHFFRYYSGGNNEQGDVDVFDGTNWITVYTVNSDTGGWNNPDIQTIDITAYANAHFKVRFHYYNANFEWFWAVDNVKVTSASFDDLAIIWGIPGVSWPNGETYFSCIIKNNGNNTVNDFDVSVNVMDGSTVLHSETVHVTGAGLNPRSEHKINFPTTWTPSVTGQYTLSFTVSLATDDDNSNDVYARTLDVIRPHYTTEKVYTMNIYDDDASGDKNHVGTFDFATGNFTDIDSIQGNMHGEYSSAGDFLVSDSIVMIVDISNTVYVMTDDAHLYEYGFFPHLTRAITGLAVNTSQPYVYVSTSDSLYRVTPYMDITTIGDFSGRNLIVGLAYDGSNLYAVDVGTDSLYTVNTSTGNLTGIGPIGFDMNYIQDIGVDRQSGNLYGTLFDVTNQPNYVSGLFLIDKNTGQATAVGTTYSDEYSVCAVVGQTNMNINNALINAVKIYPVPATNYLYISGPVMPQSVIISDLSGKIVTRQKFDNDLTTYKLKLNISSLKPGEYILKMQFDTGVKTGIFIKN